LTPPLKLFYTRTLKVLWNKITSDLDNATRFAVAHCPCRVEAGLMERPCEHPLEDCLKFDEMADYLIEHGLGKEITPEEARETVGKSAEIGWVHFVDNAAGKVMHNCDCCGCACWNVGSIRRRKIPRHIQLVDVMPKSALGKILYSALAARCGSTEFVEVHSHSCCNRTKEQINYHELRYFI
jgi:hypothetical protein